MTLDSLVFCSTKIRFENITSANGLSQNSVFVIHEDKYGFIWFGTGDGLNRYDGYTIEKYYNEPFNKKSLIGNFVKHIVEDSNGDFYIGTQSGLCKYLVDKDQFVQYSLRSDVIEKEPDILKLLLKNDNELWLVTEYGLISFNTFTGEKSIISRGIISGNIHSILKDSEENIWLTTSADVFRYNSKSGQIMKLTADLGICDFSIHGVLFEDHEDNIWFSLGDGLYIYSPETEILRSAAEHFNIPGDKIPRDVKTVRGMCDRKYWIAGMSFGLFSLDPQEKSITSIGKILVEQFNYALANITDLFIDSKERLWVGTYGAGVGFWDPQKFRFGLISSTRDEIENISIRSVLKDEDDIVWIGGYDGLDKYSVKDGLLKHYGWKNKKADIPGATVYSIAQDPADKNILWIGTENNGFFKFYKDTEKYVVPSSEYKQLKFLDRQRVAKTIFDSKGFIWMATSNGLIKLDENYNVIKHYNTRSPVNIINDDDIQDVFEDIDGNIWLAMVRAGINKINLRNKTIISYRNNPDNINSLISDRTYCIVQDGYGYMWIGTSSGLDRLDPVTSQFTHYNTGSGLPNNTIYAILLDDHSNLWISTNNGIAKYDIKRNSFYNFDARYGLQNREFNTNAYHKAYDGEIFFGGISGVNHFYPDQLNSVKEFPSLYLTDFKIFNTSIKSGEIFNEKIILEKTITATDKLLLDYDMNSISFDFAALDYFSNQYIKYSYILENYEEKWNQAETRRFASYSNLPPGNYTFRVKSTNREGLWNDKSYDLSLTITPPIWRSTPAYLFYLVAGLGIILFVIILYKRKLHQKQMEIQKEREVSEKLRHLDKLKDNFLAQISHEIRTPINTIINFTSLLKEVFDNSKDPEVVQSFEAIDLAGRRIIRTIELILNFSELQAGSYNYSEKVIDLSEHVIEKVFNEFLLSAKRKGLSFVYNRKISGMYVKGDEYSITQIISNLVENSIKYTSKGKVELLLRSGKDKIYVDIIDTGIGISKEYLPNLFNPFSQESAGYTRSYEGNGLGLALIKKYCDLNNIKISVQSIKEQGTTFTLEFTRY
ncbi:MAG: hypothetical protein JW995_02980 [Melioribacteraceae bacterium]|nr:hypothetical protein [Melioribacteraceae bacterium]